MYIAQLLLVMFNLPAPLQQIALLILGLVGLVGLVMLCVRVYKGGGADLL